MGQNEAVLKASRRSTREAYSNRALSAEQISRFVEVGFDFDGLRDFAVIELKSGKVFGSVREATRFAEVDPMSMRDAIAEKRLLKGYVFAYAGGSNGLPVVGEYGETVTTGAGKPVVELKSGKVFGSISEAGRFAGVSSVAIRKAIGEKRLVRGYAFAYFDPDDPVNLPDIGGYRESGPSTAKRRVVELGSEKVFGSVREAAGFAGVSGPTVVRDAIVKKRLLRGYAFAYFDPDNPVNLPDIGEYREAGTTGAVKSVVELGSGKVFGSQAEAGRFAGVSDVAIRKAIGEKRLVRGYAFAYFDPDDPVNLPDIGGYRESGPSTAKRRVVELGSGEVFGSLTETAKFAGVSVGTLRDAIARKRLLKGYAFAYFDPDNPVNLPDIGEYREPLR